MIASRSHGRYTLEDYLGVEEMSAVRHEYLDGEIFAMAGDTPEHAALSAAVVVLLGSKLLGKPCRPYSSDLRVRVKATGLATYPDAAILWGHPERDPESPTHVVNPTVLVEVLSSSTEEYDREKREHYQRIESLREYVLIAQDRRQVEVFERAGETTWSHRVLGPDENVSLPSLGVSFSVSELYGAAGVRPDSMRGRAFEEHHSLHERSSAIFYPLIESKPRLWQVRLSTRTAQDQSPRRRQERVSANAYLPNGHEIRRSVA